MTVFKVSATCRTCVVMENGVTYLPEGFSVTVTSAWPFNWEELKKRLSQALGSTVTIVSNDSSWKWEQM